MHIVSERDVIIEGRPIGPEHPPYVVAELSANHNGSLERALEIIGAAADAGADAVKLQTYTADTITIAHDGPGFVIDGGLWHGRTLHDLYDEAHTPWDWHQALFARGRELGIHIFSSPFDETAVDFLEELDTPAYKIASFELVDLPLIKLAAQTGKPLILSTGMASQGEIGEAVATARAAGCRDLVLLHCVSGYPSPPEESNLRTIPDLAERFESVAGLSDHTLGVAVSIAAVAFGAAMIEKHVTLSRADGGPDAPFSLEPAELRQMVEGVRTAWAARGQAQYERTASEKDNAMFRRSLYAVADIAAGDTFTRQNIRSIRPGFGLAPKHLDRILGRRATRAIKRGTPLSNDLVAPE
ncbi:MAG: pseudaminic acid synthase [Alphaproteobacteria bacterium]|nr:pseudaminic acid synthase [Alphaproteobacteria bacterium]